MKCMIFFFSLVVMFGPASPGPSGEPSAARTSREALKAFNDLIGTWRATGTPEGTAAEKIRGFWTETMRWEWQFKGADAWLKVVVDKGKHFTQGELRFLPEKDLFLVRLTTVGKDVLVFTGPFKDKVLTVDRTDATKKETQRLVFTLLHENRFLYRYEVKVAERPLFARVYQVGATKEGEPFAASGDSRPECVVSGGVGTIPVTYKGQTYYVCCTGCRDAFKEDPDKYVKEFAERKAKKK